MLGPPTAQNGWEEMWRGLWKQAGFACHHGVAAAWVSWAPGMSRCGQAEVVGKGEHQRSHQSGMTGSSFHRSRER